MCVCALIFSSLLFMPFLSYHVTLSIVTLAGKWLNANVSSRLTEAHKSCCLMSLRVSLQLLVADLSGSSEIMNESSHSRYRTLNLDHRSV